tara:strand:- start:296 stop:2389 length:2094 start_codon:yes stop_codon:yes gene_type:complete
MNQINNQNPENGIDPIEKYGIDLTKLAQSGKIDPVIGREDETRRMIQIISRRKKNNPVLMGEPGTGKTTIIEGLAKRIIDEDVPDNLKGKRLIVLDLTAMVAGAMYKGQFEERLNNFIKSIKDDNGNTIVFIDEIHMIVGSGGQGQMDVANIIKPELAQGTLKVIGATTLNEYQKYIETDSALERRFQQIFINEPSVEDTITILRGIKDKYEVHHGISIRDSALISAALLSEKYISDRFLPDKAVDLVDEAASKLKMEMDSAPELIDNLKRKLIQLEVEQEALKKENDIKSKDRYKRCKTKIKSVRNDLNKNLAIWDKEKDIVQYVSELKKSLETLKFDMEKYFKDGNYSKASKIQYETIPSILDKIRSNGEKLKDSKFVKLEVCSEDIAEVVSKWTGIPTKKMMEGEKEKLLNMESILTENILGQYEAVKTVVDVIRISKLGFTDSEKPIGSFLFMGSSGTGKTELAKTIAESLFDNEKALIRIDMSELMEPHSVSKLIGSPPGYIGFENGGYLTEKIRRKPYSVVLFDEIEKAHPQVLNILLQVLDEGHLTDSKGRTVNFKNTIIIMTSNLRDIELETFLRPEFRNRIDETIHFNELSKDVIRKIVELNINKMVDMFKENGYECMVDRKIIDDLCIRGYHPEYGARPIKRLIKRDLVSIVSKYILDNQKTKVVEILYENGIKIVGHKNESYKLTG